MAGEKRHFESNEYSGTLRGSCVYGNLTNDEGEEIGVFLNYVVHWVHEKRHNFYHKNHGDGNDLQCGI